MGPDPEVRAISGRVIMGASTLSCSKLPCFMGNLDVLSHSPVRKKLPAGAPETLPDPPRAAVAGGSCPAAAARGHDIWHQPM